MKNVMRILRSGLANEGNGFKIDLLELAKKANLTKLETIYALNSITQYNAWDMIRD